MTETALNGDLGKRVVMHAAEMPWQPSPSPSVERKRLHRVGSAEAGQVTSVVRYKPDSSFPVHDHPEGEEILVLEGTFSDEHGDWPAGTYLLNPEGFRHAPFSKQGCVLFVKLRQFAGAGRHHVAEQTAAFPWKPGRAAGIEEKSLFRSSSSSDTTRLERWSPGANPGLETYPEGVEIFVLGGTLADESGVYPAHSWLRLPPGAHHSPTSVGGCELYLKDAGLAALRSG
jgi:anti-sigma factor ChrR (cupin superfamily)